MMRALLLPAALLAIGVGCKAYTPANPDYEFHAAFERGRAHEATGCDACHILAANMQAQAGLPIPATSVDGWVTQVDGACSSCHPFTAQLGQLPEEFECANPQAPIYESEYCRFVNYHGLINDPGTCAQANCHSTEHTQFAFFSGPIDTGDTDPPTPPENPHTVGALSEKFPLVGGHLNIAQECSNASCHPNGTANTADVQDKSDYCGNCHGRVRDSAPNGAAHYPPARLGWTDEKERDCAACHTLPGVGGGMVWPLAWTDQEVPHTFLTPHNTVEDWGIATPTPRLEPAWKRQCWSCHNQYSLSQAANPADTPDGTSQDATPVAGTIYLDFELDNARANCTDGCHGALDSGHGGGQTCANAGCHTSAGPDDVAFP